MNTEKNTKRPTHIIWQVIGDDEKARWIRIGAAWTNKDASLFTRFDSYPTHGKIIIRPMGDKPEATEDDGGLQ